MNLSPRARFWLLCSIPLWVFLFDLVLDGALARWEFHDSIHMGFVGLSALLMFFLLKNELTARRAAEEQLRKEHAELEVTVQRRSEEYTRTLRHEQSVLEAIMENSKAMLVYLDPQMRFVHANSSYVQSCGHTREELIGQNHFVLFPNAENEAIFVKARDTGEPVSYMAKPFEFPDQPWRGVTYWDWTLVPVKDPAGAVSGLVFSLRDVTEEHRAARRREEHLARLDALLKVTEHALGQRTEEDLFQSIADAAREVTDARVGVAGHGYVEGKFTVRASSRAEDAPTCPSDVSAAEEAGGLYRSVLESGKTLRLTDEELHAHPSWHGLPPGHYPLRGLLGVPMDAGSGSDRGFIMVSDKRVGDFSAEDELLLSQLAALTSLSMQHIKARTHAEHYAARMDAIFKAMADAVIVYDVTGVAVRSNAAAARIIGFDPVGSDVQSVLTRLRMHDEEGLEYKLTDLPSYRAIHGEVVVAKRLLIHAEDGVERIISASASPLWLNEMQIGVVTVWSDETEREMLIQQLESERVKLKTVIDTAPVGIAVTDEKAQLRMVNPAAEHLYAPWLRIGDPIENHPERELLSEGGTPYNLTELPFARAATFGEEHRDVEMQIRRAGGNHSHLLVNSTPIYDTGGRISGAVSIFQDITQRKHNEEALKEREREYQLLMEQAADGIVLIDQKGKIIGANSRACEMIGYEREELMQKDGTELIPPEDLTSLATTIGTITRGISVTIEHRVCRKDGTLIHVETSVRQMADGRTQAIMRDVTDRKRREEEYSRAVKTHVFDRLFRMLREFQHGEIFAMNLHRLALFARNLNIFKEASQADDSVRSRLEAVIQEFRTVTRQKLIGIASLLRIVEAEFPADSAIRIERASAAEIMSLTQNLESDTEELLAMTHPRDDGDPGQFPLESGVAIAERAETLLLKIVGTTRQLNERYTTTLSDVALSMGDSFRAKWPDIPVQIVEATRGLKGLISPAELAEILSLLMTNAREAMAGIGSTLSGRDKQLTIGLRERDTRVQIEVEDTGAGVPPKIRERIFEKGFSTKGESHGNGLDYVRDHLRPYGGELTYEERPEGGSRFVIALIRM